MKLFSYVIPKDAKEKPTKPSLYVRTRDFIKVLLWCAKNQKKSMFWIETKPKFIWVEIPSKPKAMAQDTTGKWHEVPPLTNESRKSSYVGTEKSYHLGFVWKFSKDDIKAGYFALACGEI